MRKQKRVIVIAGPTAAGKTALAIDLALQYQTEIISADSRQCYREMNIGVARPSPAELNQVPHHFIASHSIQDTVTAATFENYAIQKASSLLEHHDTIIMVGGTGLYIKAFYEGLDPIPDVSENVRQTIRQGYAINGLSWLRHEVQQKDPRFFAEGETSNPHRLMRALEVIESTGHSILSYQKGNAQKRDFDIIKLAITPDKLQLHDRIHMRVDQMMVNGLPEEVRALMPYQQLNALQTVGYKELFEYFAGNASLTEAVERIKIHSRQYAKRQLTWFRRDPSYQWFEPDNRAAIFKYVQAQLGS